MKAAIFLLLSLVFSAPAFAVEPDEMLKDTVLEQRAREISSELRCLVCQGEDIENSNADLAADLRRLVRERVAAGDTDAQVLSFLRSRYGDYVLMKPPVTGKTLLLWATPAIFMGAGLAVIFVFLRRGKKGVRA